MKLEAYYYVTEQGVECMQAKIYQMYPDADKTVLQDNEQKHFGQTRPVFSGRSAGVFVGKGPHTMPLPSDIISRILISAEHTLLDLDRSDRDFLYSMKMILSMFYRYCRTNPGIVAYLMDFLGMEGKSSAAVVNGIDSLNRNIISLLKNQAARKGHLSGEDSLEELIFFLLEEVLKMYLTALGRCCCAVFQNPEETFPSEKEMMDRFYIPLASQLKGVLAS